MRFLIFNLAVGLAILYLVQGGSFDTGSVKALVEKAPPPAPMLAEGKGHGRDVIIEPRKPTPPTVKPKPKPATQPATRPPGSGSENNVRTVEAPPPPPPLPPVEEAGEVAKLTPKAPPEGGMADLDPATAARRREVLEGGTETRAAEARAPAYTLKAGTDLMSAAERRRRLDALADEMEMIYLDKAGG